METLIEFITNNPLYGVGIVALLLFMVFALIKKMIFVALIAICLNVAYIYALNDMADEAYAKANDKYEATKDAADTLINKADSLLNP